MSESEKKAPSLVLLRDTRERAIARLSEAFARDDLELDEFERRLGIAHRSDVVAELAALTADLGEGAPAQALVPAAPAAPVLSSSSRVREQQSLVAVLGGAVRKGHWTPPRRLRVVAVLGGAELDFREAALAPGVTEVYITAVMGGVNIIVPPHLSVEMEGVAVMGGFEHSERAPVTPDPERPVLHVRGFALWGGVQIETRLLGETERDAHRRLHGRGRERGALPGETGRKALPPRKEE